MRLGKIAVISVLAALSAAIGLAMPDDDQNAEAQSVSVQAGYTYMRMICQEWGRQPRWYAVRDPIAGSDWRNDGGWAIVLERGGFTRRINPPPLKPAPILSGQGNSTTTQDTTPARRSLITAAANGTGIKAW